MTVSIQKTLLGGFAATVVMTLMAIFVAPMMTGMPMDIAAMIAGMMGVSWAMGMIAHFMLGTVVFPLAYVYVVHDRLPGSSVVRGLIWGAVLWAAAVLIVMPMAGAGFLMANVGGLMAVMASLVAHLVYGGILGAAVGEGAAPHHA